MEDIDGRIIILILFVVISAFKWLVEKIKTQGDQPHDASESLEDIYEDFREEIRQRQTTVQQQQPSQTQAPPPLPQAPSAPRQSIRQSAQPSLPSRRKKVTISAEQQAAAARFEQLTAHKNTHRNVHRGANKAIRTLLSTPHSTRQAIILHEILGKPKSMQDA
jgi:hypothetical protein